MAGQIITVKEWFFDKLNNTMSGYRCTPIRTYKTDESGFTSSDDTKLRISEVVAETEKAYQVVVDAETFGGSYKAWKTWIPKSVIESEVAIA